jgi:hypothetical protein
MKENVPAVMSVSMYPGTMTLTRILDFPTSAARARVKPVICETLLLI